MKELRGPDHCDFLLELAVEVDSGCGLHLKVFSNYIAFLDKNDVADCVATVLDQICADKEETVPATEEVWSGTAELFSGAIEVNVFFLIQGDVTVIM